MLKSAPKPYIGITGFTKREQVQRLLDHELLFERDDFMFMIGALASKKTLRGLPTKYPIRYPKIEDLGKIFVGSPYCLNLVHYHCDPSEFSADDLIKIHSMAGDVMNGFQLNITWPDPAEIKKYLAVYPDSKIVLQVGNEAFDEIHKDPTELTSKVITDYMDCIDYVLLDASAGQGIQIDYHEKYFRYLRDLKSSGVLNVIRAGVAGGFCSTNVVDVDELFADVGCYLSIDAEGKLRNPDTDELIMEEVFAYANTFIVWFLMP